MILAVIFIVGAATSAPTPQVIEKVVALVDRQTITLVDVKRAAAIEIAKQVGSMVYARPWPRGFLAEIRKHLMQRTLLLEEARRYSQQEPTQVEIDAAFSAFKARFENNNGFKRFLDQTLLSEDELREDLRKTLYVERFLIFRIRSRIELPEDLHEEARQKMLDEEFVKRTLLFMRELVDKAEVRMLGEVPDANLQLQ